MPKQYQTPGVFVNELSTNSNSVVGASTSIPAFVGYTQKVSYNGSPLKNKPTRVSSLEEYHKIFGIGNDTIYDVVALAEGTLLNEADIVLDGKGYQFGVHSKSYAYLMYQSIVLFYANGGGAAYIVSVGDYSVPINVDDLEEGIQTVKNEPEPSILVVPETMLLADRASCYRVQKKMIQHCANLKNRIALLDVYEGYLERDKDGNEVVENFRNGIDLTEGLSYAAAYYPWMHTDVVKKENVDFSRLSAAALKLLVPYFMAQAQAQGKAALQSEIEKLNGKIEASKVAALHKKLMENLPLYGEIITALTKKLNILPVTGGIAGIYAATDNNQGVWKAPANVSLAGAIAPLVSISNNEQEDLQIPLDGKAINPIRSFPGHGLLVWGARTMEGNSMNWRYVPIRRTIIFLEQSIQLSLQAYVFEPNNTNTWESVKTMVSGFLKTIWTQGGLVGASADQAFNIKIGLGETMTANDILNGVMRLEVNVALVHPAEFIRMKFEQKIANT